MSKVIEGVKVPKDVEELKKLAEDPNLFIVFNAFGIIQRYSKDPVNYDDCYRMRPLSWRVNNAIDRDKLDLLLVSLIKGNEYLVRIP